MAAGEDQPQPVVLHGTLIARLFAEMHERRLGVPISARCLAPHAINRTVAGVVMIHPAGLGGTPRRRPTLDGRGEGVLDRVLAMSMSPKERTRTATARPCSSRNTPAISCSVTAGLSPAPPPGTGAPRLAPSRARRLPRPLKRGVEIRRLDHPEAPDMLLALDKRTIRCQDLVASSPTTVAVLDGCSPPANTHPSASRSSSFKASTSRMISSMLSGGSVSG